LARQRRPIRPSLRWATFKKLSNLITGSEGQQPPNINAAFRPANIKRVIEGQTGLFHQPETTAGRYAEAAGEFVPMALAGPGSLAGRVVAQGVIPGLISEGAGDVAKLAGLDRTGEDVAKVVGAMAAPFGMARLRRVATPNAIAPERQALVDTLRNEGVTDLTAGQVTGSKPQQWFENSMSDLPFAGGRASRTAENQAEQFTAAAMRRAGDNAARRANPEAIDRNFSRIGQQLDDLAAANWAEFDGPFVQQLQRARGEYNQMVPESQRAPAVDGIIGDIINHHNATGGVMTGEAYQAWRSRIDRMARATDRYDSNFGNLEPGCWCRPATPVKDRDRTSLSGPRLPS